MKVSELIAALKEFDPETEVVIERDGAFGSELYEDPKPYWTRHLWRRREEPNAMIVILGRATTD